MKKEYRIRLDNEIYPVLLSDEREALLAAQAAGRAVVGLGTDWDGEWMRRLPYVVPSLEDASEELARLVLLRHLGRPWTIARTEHLLIRELTREDAAAIPAEENARDEEIFRSPELLSLYIEKQYRFYEYGTWALVLRKTGDLVGLAGVSNPRLPDELSRMLPEAGDGLAWLELGYHIFRPWRRRGLGREAAFAIMEYSREVLSARLCALIAHENKASRALAEGLGMKRFGETVSGTDTQSSSGYLLYGESC